MIHIRYERALVHMQLAIEPAPPHLVHGLQLTGADLAGDTMDAVLAELARLAGPGVLRNCPARRRARRC